MHDAKTKYSEIIQKCLQQNCEPLIVGELRGYDAELMEKVVFSSTWDTSNCKKSLGIIEHLVNKIVADNK